MAPCQYLVFARLPNLLHSLLLKRSLPLEVAGHKFLLVDLYVCHQNAYQELLGSHLGARFH